MKIFLFSLVAMLSLLGWTLHAETVTFDFATAEGLQAMGVTPPGTSKAVVPSSLFLSPVKIAVTQGPNLSTGQELRIYNSNGSFSFRTSSKGGAKAHKFSFSTDNGANITEIVFTATKFGVSSDEGTLSSKTWTGDAAEVTFTTTGEVNITKIEVTYGIPDPTKTAKPSIVIEPTVEGANALYCDNEVTISCSTEGAKIYYTTDGTTPTEQSNVYGDPFVVKNAGVTAIKAMAVAEGQTASVIASASVEIKQAGFPKFSPEAGTYDEIPLEISIASPTTEATIYYTTDGSDPSDEANASRVEYKEPFTIDRTTTVKATAKLGNTGYCKVQQAKYVIDALGSEVTFNFGELQQGMAADDSDNWTGVEIPDTWSDATAPAVAEISKDDVSVTFNSLGSQANQKFRLWYTSGAVQLRISKGGITEGSSFTVTAPEGKQITAIVFRTNSGSSLVSAFTPDMGACSSEDKEVKWTGSASSVTFTGSDEYSGKTVQIMGIDVICGESLAPVFNWNTGDYYEPFNLTMTTGLAGGKIAYTTNGNDPVVTFDAATETWVLGNGTNAYTAPVKISATSTVKAVAYGQRENPVNHIVENYVTDITAAAYTFKTADALPATVDNLSRLVKWFTEANPVNLAKSADVNYPNIRKVVRLPFALRATACTKDVLYVDDNAPDEENSGIIVTRPNTNWTAVCKPFDLFNEGWIVSFEWENQVTPKLVLHNVPSLSIYEQPEFEIPVVTAEAVASSDAWNKEIVENSTMHNDWLAKEIAAGHTPGINFVPVTDTDIKLLDPSMVSELVEIKDVKFTSSTRGNKGNTPNATFSGKGAEGSSLDFVTRFIIDSYAAGTYNVKGIVAYNVEITTKTIDKVKVPTDTTVSVVVYPTELTLVEGGGDITEKAFAAADEASEGEWLFVAAGMAFTPLDSEKTYGYMPVQEVKAEGDTIRANAEFAVTLVATPDDPEYFYMKDSFGRFIYQTGDYNSFNVSTELPEDANEASWMFEPTEDADGNPCWMIVNAATGKYVQYSKQYNSFGCYADNTEDRVLPVIYRSTGTVTGIADVIAPVIDGKAEIFNIQGQRMNGSLESLPAGIYLVRRGNVTSKVIVR